MTNPIQRGARLPLLDALRAFALFGILQVNIQSFVWGNADPLGFLVPTASWADTAAYLLVATLVSYKFMALFAFLFGYGFAVQMKSLRGSQTAYRQRLWFLLLIGLVHGCLLYYGDVLAAYALCGFILVRYANDRPAALAKSARRWWLGFALWFGVLVGGLGVLDRIFGPTDGSGAIPDAALLQHQVYSTGSYLAQLRTRIPEYFSSLSLGAFLYVPMVTSLFLLGALAARLGWLRYPQRHPQVWRWAVCAGAAGLALACTGAALGFITHAATPGRLDFLSLLFTTGGLTTMALYVAWIVRHQHTPWVRHVIHWLAPAGRMPLTNYLVQSLLMGALLSGWGLGLGATLGRAQLAGLAVGLVVLQIMLSRAWVAHYGKGPMEALWRRATYS